MVKSLQRSWFSPSRSKRDKIYVDICLIISKLIYIQISCLEITKIMVIILLDMADSKNSQGVTPVDVTDDRGAHPKFK